MQDQSPQSPEARRHRLKEEGFPPAVERTGFSRAHAVEIAKRVVVGVYTDGFIHAGNLAYLTLLALFPFFIVAVTIARIFGQSDSGLAAVNAFLVTLPANVADVLRKPIFDVLTAQTDNLLWFGAVVGLWTVGSLIETIRDIVRRAYGTSATRPFWHYRLGSIGIIFVCVFAILFAFSLQVMISAAETLLHQLLPFADEAITLVQASRLLPAVILFVGLHYLFVAIAPSRYRSSAFPKWPGAAVTALWWYGTVLLLPLVLSSLTDYSLTYGGLAGAMVTLIFFFIIGLGVVIGAELNAALAEFPDSGNGAAQDMPAGQDKETVGE
ncbi:MAG TPA: YihY/virulence factor BrkB family protein [Sphingobium sp.]|nr:YihY/virulence factor BrkB family protein [Sphingobium sp.]